MKAPYLAIIVIHFLCVLCSQSTCRAQMFQTSKPSPVATEGKIYNAGAGGYKTDSATQVIVTGKDGVSKVYNAGPGGYKTGSPVQVIDSKR